MQTKTVFISLLFVVLLAGCKKSAVIWGTWQQTGLRQVNQINHSTTYDMTNYITTNGVVFTFTVGGGYFSTNSNGQYKQLSVSGKNELHLIDTTSSSPHSIYFTIVTLTDQLLVLQKTDTISTSPLMTVEYTYTLSPV